jgi:hypothetical protein
MWREQFAEHVEAVGFGGAGGGGDVSDGGVDGVVDGLRRLAVPVVRTVSHDFVPLEIEKPGTRPGLLARREKSPQFQSNGGVKSF